MFDTLETSSSSSNTRCWDRVERTHPDESGRHRPVEARQEQKSHGFADPRLRREHRPRTHAEHREMDRRPAHLEIYRCVQPKFRRLATRRNGGHPHEAAYGFCSELEHVDSQGPRRVARQHQLQTATIRDAYDRVDSDDAFLRTLLSQGAEPPKAPLLTVAPARPKGIPPRSAGKAAASVPTTTPPRTTRSQTSKAPTKKVGDEVNDDDDDDGNETDWGLEDTLEGYASASDSDPNTVPRVWY